MLFTLSVYNAFERFRFFTSSPFLRSVLNKDPNLISSRPCMFHQPVSSWNSSCYLATEQQEDCLSSKANENICVNCSGLVLRSRARRFISIWQRIIPLKLCHMASNPSEKLQLKWSAHLHIIPLVISEQSTSNWAGTKCNFGVLQEH